MEILEAFDLTGTLRSAAELVGVITRRWRAGCAPARRPAAGCQSRPGGGRGQMRSPRRSSSGWTACAGGSAPASPISGWWRWAISARSARSAERSRRPSGRGGPNTAGGRGRGKPSLVSGCSGTSATGRHPRAQPDRRLLRGLLLTSASASMQSFARRRRARSLRTTGGRVGGHGARASLALRSERV
jgi:hypothetical protein